MHRHSHHRDSLDQEFDELLAGALVAYTQKQEAFKAAIASFTQWNIDETTGALLFTGCGGSRQTFNVTPIATYMPAIEEWAWAWANESWPEPSRLKSSCLKALSARPDTTSSKRRSFAPAQPKSTNYVLSRFKSWTGSLSSKSKIKTLGASTSSAEP
jgi:hypothetical protein